MTLPPVAFDDFFIAVHGHSPFPWQSRLARHVLTEGCWPALLDLPTGTGKTAAIDVAVYALAMDPTRAPRRTVLVVDRRTIVDQAHVRALQIAEKLHNATGTTILGRVAAALRTIAHTEQPLAVAILRGAMPHDDAWARSPGQPLLAISTVDQVGSRLLFRGYGVSRGMRPVHAGLLGNDVLYLLDEVHLSQPFAQTLDAISKHYRSAGANLLPERWGVVRMSATPHETSSEAAFSLDADDRAHPLLQQRLSTHKQTTIREVKVRGDEELRRAILARACASAAREHLDRDAQAVAVIVNRVDTARHTWQALAAESDDAFDCRLVTGRMRPMDRTDLDGELAKRVGANRTRDHERRPIVVVATQCIEAGADFDFDAIVTECASLDSLRQRFGRLDRLGQHGTTEATILCRSDQTGSQTDDPVYGEALSATWSWLNDQDSPIDLGLATDQLPPTDRLPALLAPAVDAPTLLPTHLDAWAQTNPGPQPDPDISLWLHGPDRERAEVHIVWRADLDVDVLVDDRLSEARERVATCPPSSLESVTIPIYAARAWLAQSVAPSFGDVVGARALDAPGEDRVDDESMLRNALVWRGDESTIASPKEIKPGDTLVVPAEYGGLAAGSWDPQNREPVSDIGDHAHLEHRGRLVVRLHPDVCIAAGLPTAMPADEIGDDRDIAAGWVSEAIAAGVPEWLREPLEGVQNGNVRSHLRVSRVESTREGETYLALLGRKRIRFENTFETSTEGDTASHTGVTVSLQSHLQGVGDHARQFAATCTMPDTLINDISLAGHLHDLGKADPRFQRLLHGGSEYMARKATELLAKSPIPAVDATARRIARERSGYPEGARHELLSVALIESCAALRAQANDWELVLHLVASHHGWCRPFAPVQRDQDPLEVSVQAGEHELRASSAHGLDHLDSGIADRFWSLVGRYGWFGLTWLETILRLADHRRSELEQRGLLQ